MSQRLFAFESLVGWIGILHRDQKIERIRIGYRDETEILKAFAETQCGPTVANREERSIERRFHAYLAGDGEDLTDLEINTSSMTSFQRTVSEHCRRIPAGQTRSYGALAKSCGHDRAARAVGTVMRKNAFPLVVPCHRVVGANGIGGFSSPRGVELKQQLQAIERGNHFLMPAS